MATCGRRLCFHGAFSRKRNAQRKERARKGARILERDIRGHRRFIVVTEK